MVSEVSLISDSIQNFNMKKILVFIIFNATFLFKNVKTQTGDFLPYGVDNKDTEVNRDTTAFVSTSGFSGVNDALVPRSVVWNLPTSIRVWGEDIRALRIYESGVVGLSVDDHLPFCPPRSRLFTAKYIAPYWIYADISLSDSRMYYRMEDVTDNSTMSGKVNYTALVEEVNQARQVLNGADGAPISEGDVKTVTIITWKNMMPRQGDLINPGYRLTFQLCIVSTATRSYSLIIYDRLDFHALPNQGSNCGGQALAGLNYLTATQFYSFELSAYFYLAANNLLLHTNIMSYTRLGRYCLILDFVLVQPVPPKLNCAVPEDQQDPYCKLGLNPSFCNGRNPGLYEHPSFCDRFVYCLQGEGLEVHRCQNGLGFNPYFRTCDYYGYFRCQNIMRGQVGLFIGRMQHDFEDSSLVAIDVEYNEALQKLVFAIHNNTCITKGDGNYADATSCSHFLQCSNTRTIRSRCQQGLYFDPYENQCDYKRNVDCKDGIRPTRSPNATTPVIDTTKSTPTNTVIDTTKITPTNTTTTTEGPPTPRPEPTPRPQMNTTEGLTFPPEPPSNPCENLGDWKQIPDPKSCYVRITCYNGEVHSKMYCPPGLYYSTEHKVCDFIRNVDCIQGERPDIPDKEPPIPTNPPIPSLSTLSFNIFEACHDVPGGNGKIPDPDDSSRFFVCHDYTIFGHKQCLEGQLFDRFQQRCYILGP